MREGGMNSAIDLCGEFQFYFTLLFPVLYHKHH